MPNRERCTAHPFLLAAGRLCVSALITRQPERFCWIDENDTAGRVGACSPSTDVRRVQRLWIPDSMGWSVLEPRAERLLADVMLLLNLADRGDSLAVREERLRRADLASLRYLLPASAPWQSVPRSEMRRFWRQMSWRDLPRFHRW